MNGTDKQKKKWCFSFFFYKKGRRNRKPRTSATAAKSFHNKLKKREREKGDRRERERRQDHSACRATEEAGEERVISFVQKMKQMLALSENCLHRNDIKPQWRVVKRFHCWVHTEASVRGIESKRHYWELEHWQYNIQFSYTRRPLWPCSSAWLFDRKLQRVSSGSSGGLRRTFVSLQRIWLSHVGFRRACLGVWVCASCAS